MVFLSLEQSYVVKTDDCFDDGGTFSQHSLCP